MSQTLFDKLWTLHRVSGQTDGADLIAIDRTMLHERTGAAALKALASRGLRPIAPERVFAVMDHVVSFKEGRGKNDSRAPGGDIFITETRAMAEAAGIHLIDSDDARQGIVHVIAPELGIVLPGVSIVCPDSHTCSLGAYGALAWGVGSSDAAHAIATGVIRIKKPQQMRVTLEGVLAEGVSAKDVALALIAAYGAGGGARMAIEFTGPVVRNLSIEGRMTLCNMAVEFAAFTALIAPDDRVIESLKGRSFSPDTADWDAASAHWQTLKTDPDADFDREIMFDVSDIAPMVTWGTSPEDAIAVSGKVPATANDRALDYMGLAPGQSLAEQSIAGAFIGSCTNGRLSDLRQAAEVLRGRRVADGVQAVCVPGSKSVRRAAEAEGLDKIFRAAGFSWGAPGCAMCFYAGGETFAPEARVISSTNRNFEGRQGPGVRTHLASPATVAASAIAGRIADPRAYLTEAQAEPETEAAPS